MTWRLAVAHACPPTLDLAAAARQACGLIAQAGSDGVQLLAFPETFLPGFPYWLNAYAPAHVGHLYRRSWEEAVDPHPDDPAIAMIADACRTAKVSVVVGATVRARGSLENGLIAIGANGRYLGCRRKLVPTASERTLWSFGRTVDLEPWPTSVGPVTGMMCWEHTMAIPRELVARADAPVHVAAWPGLTGLAGYGQLFRVQVDALVRSHAITTQSFVLSAMSPLRTESIDRIATEVGSPTNLLHEAPGWSAILHPSGVVLAETKGSADEIVAADVDLDDVIDAKRIVDVDGHSSRDDLFHVTLGPIETGPATTRPVE